jgi:hypothetical protein
MAVYLFRGDRCHLTYSKEEGHRITRLADNRRAWVPPLVADEILLIGEVLCDRSRQLRAEIDKRLSRYVS